MSLFLWNALLAKVDQLAFWPLGPIACAWSRVVDPYYCLPNRATEPGLRRKTRRFLLSRPFVGVWWAIMGYHHSRSMMFSVLGPSLLFPRYVVTIRRR